MAELSGLFAQIADAVEDGDEVESSALTARAVSEGHSPRDIIKVAMAEGVRRAGIRFNSGEFYLPELMLTGEAMRASLSILMPLMLESTAEKIDYKARVMLGTVEGDVHDLGKNIFATMLQSQGFEVIDLGIDNDADWIMEQLRVFSPDVLGMGSYMTTTMVNIPPLFERIRSEGLGDEMKLLVGGISVNRRWAASVARADGYAEDAWEGVEMVHELLGLDSGDSGDIGYGRDADKTRIR